VNSDVRFPAVKVTTPPKGVLSCVYQATVDLILFV